MEKNDIYKKNLKLIIIETILTSIGVGFSIPTINLFWNSIGMNQTDIGFTQMMFTIVIVFLDIPMGYLADRFNRKVLNIIGDIGVAITFLCYALAQNMIMAIVSECCLGIFMAMTNGVDQSFIKYNAYKIDASGKLFKKINAKIYTLRYIVCFSLMLIGGFIAKYSLRLTIGMSFVPYMIGGVIAIFINDSANKMESRHNNVFKDMFIKFKDIVKNSKTKTYLFLYIIGREITHPHIWIFTPLMIMVGVPIEVVSIGWIFSEIFKIIGSKISEKIVDMKTSTKFLIILSITVLWMSTLIIKTNIYTVWVFVLNGVVVGIVSGSLVTPLQECTGEENQTYIMSIASTGSRLLYIPLVFVINYLAEIKLQLAFVGMLGIFIPVSVYLFYKIKIYEKESFSENKEELTIQ